MPHEQLRQRAVIVELAFDHQRLLACLLDQVDQVLSPQRHSRRKKVQRRNLANFQKCINAAMVRQMQRASRIAKMTINVMGVRGRYRHATMSGAPKKRHSAP
jgi:hypothetical protein